MTISHNLNGNGYFINNEIWFNITANEIVNYFKITITNNSNGKISSPLIAYTDSENTVFVNIQSVIKSLFSIPNGETNNSAQFNINISALNSSQINENITLTKNFVRGGKRTNDTNQTITPNQTLRLYSKIPVWSGFPVYDYFLNGYYVIEKQNLADVSNIDYRSIKGCNNIYIKFLNQNGGYSYWLFESYSEKENATPLGSLVGGNKNFIDLGQESKSDLKIYSKIPKEYSQYAKDVIDSSDVYAYQNGSWKKIFLKSNSVEFDNVKKVYVTNLNIDLKYRFNPSLLWSN